jgi:SPP1 family predicted phage head-tail adaptor
MEDSVLMSCAERITLDRVIIIQIYTDSKDSVGGPIISWATHATVKANANWVSGDESEIVDKVTAITKVKFVIRHRTDLDAKMRISFDGDYYNIIAILDDQYNKYLTLITELVE